MGVFDKRVRTSVVIALSVFSLSACQTTQNWQKNYYNSCTKKKTPGDFAECLVTGAAIGGTLGLLFGDNKECAKTCALIDAAEARQKQQYANAEALLDAETKELTEFLDLIRKVNENFRKDIKAHKHEIARLKIRISMGRATSRKLEEQRAKAKKQSEIAKRALKGVQNRLDVARQLYEDAEDRYNKEVIKKVETENKLEYYNKLIYKVEREKRELEKYVYALSVMGTAIS